MEGHPVGFLRRLQPSSLNGTNPCRLHNGTEYIEALAATARSLTAYDWSKWLTVARCPCPADCDGPVKSHGAHFCGADRHCKTRWLNKLDPPELGITSMSAAEQGDKDWKSGSQSGLSSIWTNSRPCSGPKWDT
jgi:hypothetical protein